MGYSERPVPRLALRRDDDREANPFDVRMRAANACALGFGLVIWFCAAWGSAAPLDFLSSDGEHRRQAIETIPSERMTEEAHAKIRDVINRPSIYRRMPVTVVRSDPELYLFLVRHPEVIVNMWDLMGVTKVSVARTGDYTFDAKDGSGTSCQIELLYGDRDVHVLYSEGRYEGPLLKRLIHGRCVLILTSNYAETQDGSTYVTSRLDMFVRFDNVGAEFLARTLHPLVGKSADHNFIESTKFLGQVSQAAEVRLDRLLKFSQRLKKVDVKVREEFDTIASAVGQRTADRAAVFHVGDGRTSRPRAQDSRPAHRDMAPLFRQR